MSWCRKSIISVLNFVLFQFSVTITQSTFLASHVMVHSKKIILHHFGLIGILWDLILAKNQLFDHTKWHENMAYTSIKWDLNTIHIDIHWHLIQVYSAINWNVTWLTVHSLTPVSGLQWHPATSATRLRVPFIDTLNTAHCANHWRLDHGL